MGVKIFQIAFLLVALTVPWLAVPASVETFFIKQPDGSSVEVRQVGDENFHVLETADGYILQKDALGFYAYADARGESSGIYARDAQNRSGSDIQFLAALDPDAIYQKLLTKAPSEELQNYNFPKFIRPRIQRMPIPDSMLTQGDFRGMVVLVQYADIKFKAADPKAQFTDFLNKEGYNEYHHQGSVRDYFIKNSMGIFRPTFDVYGPITVPNTRATYASTTTGNKNFAAAKTILATALDSLDKRGEIDFSKYDNDGDGMVDFVFMIYAGVGSNGSGVDDAIWPHANYFNSQKGPNSGKKMSDGSYINYFACSNEIGTTAYRNDKSTSTLNGIGTFIHEFSHVLGLPDLNDTKGTNKTRKDPTKWSVMSTGVYNCPSNPEYVQCCAPPFYSAFERMSLGWMTPMELNVKGEVKLDKIEDNVAYSVTNPKNPKEVYLLEYRNRKKWDAGQPSSGMLIWHIDYVDSIWNINAVNANAAHMYVDVVEAVPAKGTTATAEDVFPGTGKVTDFSNFVFWTGDSMKIALSDITESSDKEYVTFNVDMTVKSSPSVKSSSSTKSSSSAISSSSANFSSSNTPSSSSSVSVSSSSRITSSSSAISSSAVSSSSKVSSSSSMTSSSSETIASSSSEHSVFAMRPAQLPNVHVQMHNGHIFIYAPQHGQKNVRLFSPIGTLLFETTMDGNELKIENMHQMQGANAILSVTQGRKQLFTGLLSLKNF